MTLHLKEKLSMTDEGLVKSRLLFKRLARPYPEAAIRGVARSEETHMVSIAGRSWVEKAKRHASSSAFRSQLR